MNKIKAIILSRISTKDQQRFGSSLESQILKSKQYAQKNNLDVVKNFYNFS